MKNNLSSLISILITVLFFSAVVFSQTTEFTYQGSLQNSSVPANGNFDFEFLLYDAVSGGVQIGTTLTRSTVAVAAGTFAVKLDFGPQFPGANRFLEIRVRQTGGGAYTPLAPRQQVNSAPYSVKAVNATNATNAATATNVSGVVQIANGGTGGSTQNFADLTTNQTIAGNKTFSGTLSGNGSGLTNVPGTLKWNMITNNQQAVSNNGYVVNSGGEVRITLPTAPQVGDIIRVACADNGGFRITQNAGQSITVSNADIPNLPWTPRESIRNWYAVASSADGSKLVAVVFAGQIYTSTDSGVTWTPQESNRAWRSVASSSDGTKLVATVANGNIYTSTDSGVRWTPRESIRQWRSVASSSDGTKLVATVDNGNIYTSTNSGVEWTPRESIRQWRSVASSSDGTKLVATVGNGNIYTSTNSGVEWTPREPNRVWGSVASSADGTKLVAFAVSERIYLTTDSGVTWTPQEGYRDWSSVASSADGSKLVATVGAGQIFTSTDSGVTWTPQESNRSWQSVASSADGTKLVAVVDSGQIYVRASSVSTVGEAGGIRGGNSASLELIYLGAGKFLILSQLGGVQFF